MLRAVLAGSVLFAMAAMVATFFYSKSAVIDEIMSAARREDVQGVSARVDWLAVRGFLKENLVEQKKAQAVFGDIGPPAAQIPAVVDYYVQPDNLAILFYLHHELFPTLKEEDFIDSTGYAFPFGFQMTLGVPKNLANANEIPAIMRDKLKVRFVFRLDGTTWKVKEMHVPLFMVPSAVYDTPAVKIYGPPEKQP